MWILCIYILNVVVGETLVLTFGFYLDRIVPTASLSISLTFFFVVLWLGWVLAVRWTRPETKAGVAPAAK